jgi:hypothetical protein
MQAQMAITNILLTAGDQAGEPHRPPIQRTVDTHDNAELTIAATVQDQAQGSGPAEVRDRAAGNTALRT